MRESITHERQPLADDAVVFDIQSEAWCVELDGQKWWDTRPMLDPNEHSPQTIDQAAEALAYARSTGLVATHPHHAHLVRITRS